MSESHLLNDLQDQYIYYHCIYIYIYIQVASQQAIYLAKVLNAESIGGVEKVWTRGAANPFLYKHLGSMASVGQWKGVYDSTSLG